jgi:hypothetical protein
MKRRYPRPASRGPLRRELVDLLLDDRPSPEQIDAMNDTLPDGYDAFYEFDVSRAEAARLRIVHRRELIAAAAQRGLGADRVDRIAAQMGDAAYVDLPPRRPLVH